MCIRKRTCGTVFANVLLSKTTFVFVFIFVFAFVIRGFMGVTFLNLYESLTKLLGKHTVHFDCVYVQYFLGFSEDYAFIRRAGLNPVSCHVIARQNRLCQRILDVLLNRAL